MVTAANHHSIRQLLMAHGAPLPPAPADSAQEATPFLLRSADLSGAATSAAQQAQQLLHCHEFTTYEQGLRFCEEQLMAVAVRYQLCRPPSQAITLEQLLRSHARCVGAAGAG